MAETEAHLQGTYKLDAASQAAIDPIIAEHAEVEKSMTLPEIVSDQNKMRRLGRRYAELSRIVAAYQKWKHAADDVEAAKELSELDGDDADEMAGEIAGMEDQARAAYEHLREVLVPRDPDDARDVILEIKAGEGGEESALFAADLMRMYQRYAEHKGWSFEVLAAASTDMGGIKDAQLVVRTKGTVSDPSEGVWSYLKHEGGVHRVQRVPVTESQGRIHTSAAGVLALPEVDDPEEVEIHPNDLRIDVYRSSGPGGQSVNTTDSAVRITHLPTGIVVAMQDEKSQLQNREAAMRVLRARLLAAQREEQEAAAAAQRKSQVRTVDRSERIRTYNFPENRIADHRTGYKAYNLDRVLDGELDQVLQANREQENAERLADAARDHQAGSQ